MTLATHGTTVVLLCSVRHGIVHMMSFVRMPARREREERGERERERDTDGEGGRR